MKIANSEEDPIVTEFQIFALVHINSKNNKNISVPKVIISKDGKNSIKLQKGNKSYTTRIVSYLDGVPLFASKESEPNPSIAEGMGLYLAHLGRSLKDFSHPGSNQSLLWDMKKALSIREITHHIISNPIRTMVEEVLNEANNGNIKTFSEFLEILNKPYLEQKNIINYQVPSSSNEKYQTFCGT